MKKIFSTVFTLLIIFSFLQSAYASDFSVRSIRFRTHIPGPGFSIVTSSHLSEDDILDNFGENIVVNGKRLNEYRNFSLAGSVSKNFSPDQRTGWYIFYINHIFGTDEEIVIEVLDTFYDKEGNTLSETQVFKGNYPEEFGPSGEISLRVYRAENDVPPEKEETRDVFSYIIIFLSAIVIFTAILVSIKKKNITVTVIIAVAGLVLIPVYYFAFFGSEAVPTETEETTKGEADPFARLRNEEITPQLNDLLGEPGNTDIIVWYDIDIGPTTNARPQQGWWPLNPNHPDEVQVDGHFRTTTPLLGLYDCRDPKTAYQHAYWISAMGGHGFAIDLTNFKSPRAEGEADFMISFWDGILKNCEVLYDTLSTIEDFDAPRAYPVMRLDGIAPGEDPNLADYGKFQLAMDDMYALYEKYPDQWYKLDDGTERADRPFITIFVHWTTLSNWQESGEYGYDDERFNIRFSNGGIHRNTVPDERGYRRIESDVPYWYFAQEELHIDMEKRENSYYLPFYKVSQDNKRIEQMIAQGAILSWGEWDGMLSEVNGKITFSRTIEPAFELNPQVLLVNRFNYANAWRAEPQEGLSLNGSIHIEPNEDWGFEVFNIVSKDLYRLNALDKIAPPAPSVSEYDSLRSRIKIDLSGYPLEYRISGDELTEEDSWVYLNVAEGGIFIPENINAGSGVYIQTRNSFGESEVAFFSP